MAIPALPCLAFLIPVASGAAIISLQLLAGPRFWNWNPRSRTMLWSIKPRSYIECEKRERMERGEEKSMTALMRVLITLIGHVIVAWQKILKDPILMRAA